MLLTLNKDHVRGSGIHIPRGIGNHYGLNFGDGIDLTSPHGTVRMGTDKLRTLRLSSIRRFIESLGAGVGDRVWLTFGDDRSFAVSLAPKFQPELTGFASLYNHIGLDITAPELRRLLQQEAADTTISPADLLAPINEALGIKPRYTAPAHGLAAASAQPRRSGGCYLRSLRSTANVALTLP